MAVYHVSPDGSRATSQDFNRMFWGGCNYVGIPDPYRTENTTKETGLWIMDMETGKSELIKNFSEMAQIMPRENGIPNGVIFIFSVPTGTRQVHA